MLYSETVANEFRQVVEGYSVKFLQQTHDALGRGEAVCINYGKLQEIVFRDFNDIGKPDKTLILEIWEDIIAVLKKQGFIVDERKGCNWSTWNCYVKIPRK